MTPQDEIERKCYTLWLAIKDMDTIETTPKNKLVLDTLIGYIAKDANFIFKQLGAYLQEAGHVDINAV